MLLLSLISILLYGAGSALLLFEILHVSGKIARYATGFLLAGFGLDTFTLIESFARAIMSSRLPVTSPSDIYGLLGWVCMGIVVLMRLKFRFPAVTGFFAPAGFALAAVAFFLPGGREPVEANLPGFLYALHIAMVFMSLGIFGLAFVAALFYLLVHRELKTKRFGKIFLVLPPLDTLDHLTVRALVLGVVLLTLGIVSGIYLAHAEWRKDWVTNPKFLFSIATWIWYVLLLSVRRFAGWRGGQFFALIVVAFGLLLVTFLGVTAFFPTPARRPLAGIMGIAAWKS
ncbi:MAG: cytochrome c biogenesis protein CcsA [Pseudomonadota bacterium]